MEEKEILTYDEAIKFFAELYNGEHHIPDQKCFPFGQGFIVKHDRGDLATFDFDMLTRLVLMAHRDCYRASVFPFGTNKLKIAIWKRTREGSFSHRHPTIEQAIDKFNGQQQ